MRGTVVRDKAASAGPRSLKCMLAIFDAVAHSHDGLSLAELSSRLGSPKSILLTLLRPMVADNFLTHTNGRYTLGNESFALATSILSTRKFGTVVRGLMVELQQHCPETIILAVRSPNAKRRRSARGTPFEPVCFENHRTSSERERWDFRGLVRRVDTLISIRFIAQRPTQSSCAAVSQLGIVTSRPSMLRTRGRSTSILPPWKPIRSHVRPQRCARRAASRPRRRPAGRRHFRLHHRAEHSIPAARQNRSTLARTSPNASSTAPAPANQPG